MALKHVQNEATPLAEIRPDLPVDTQWREREFDKLRADIIRCKEHAQWELIGLNDDIKRYKLEQLEVIPKLLLDVDRFFIVYEREVRPLNEDVKRFWRRNVALKRLLMSDLRGFYHHSEEEAAELEADFRRFIDYSSVEWARLKIAVRRFATCDHDPAFGDAGTPGGFDQRPGVYNDHLQLDEDFIIHD